MNGNNAQEPPKIFGYVQAGGGSTRFGSDKALALIAGQPLLLRTVEVVAAACGNAKIVASAPTYRSLGIPILADNWPGQGPLGGILTALEETQKISAQPCWSLIVSCDMPFLSREWLCFLAAKAMQGDAQVVAAESAHGLEPLCACWHTQALPTLRDAFDAGVRKVTEAMKRLRMEVLDAPVWKRFDTDGRLFWNMNTLEDYAEARRLLETGNR